MGIVERVKISAAEKGLTLAKIERTLGFGNSTIRKWDQNSPSLDKVIATANLLNKSLSWLATGNYENASGDSEFICLYEKLSELEKEKIKHFIEICLADISSANTEESKPINYSEIPKADLSYVQESPSYYQTKQDIIAILGYVAAGEPIEGISIPLGYIPDTVNADYALIAKGHSMEPVILDGEYIFVKKCESLDYGDIGIFYINGDVTCKKYHPQPDRLVLQSLNPDFKPFKYSLNDNYDFKIQGKVILTSTQKNRFS